ncbi:MAG: methyltransferase domain-containing protein [Spirochaetales bacterium]|nr:methyltransferase domain-containing protein [Spirochaetales bacterium]
MITSKAWNWDSDIHDYWKKVSDEFLPVMLKWKSNNFLKILDLGCGIGRNALYMARLNFDVYAFDLSDSGLSRLADEAEKNMLSINIKRGDMLDLPYDDDFFDCVLGFHSIYHTDYEGLQKVISGIYRIVKKGGELFITLNSKESDVWQQYGQYADKKIDEYTLIKTETAETAVPHTYLDYKEVLELLSGFSIIRIQQIFDYFEDRKHAHFFITCRKEK